MTQSVSSVLASGILTHLAEDPAFADELARLVAAALLGGELPAAKRGGRAPAAPAKRGPGRPPGSKTVRPLGGSEGEGSVQRVLAAVRSGAENKRDILGRTGLSDAAYSYAIKTLREEGLIRILGTRGTARIIAV